jgi:mono/diheme cytochrome c family protein
LVALGERIYAKECAACHGRNLEGQPNWRSRRPDGRLPAPPHDATGHTWHHPDFQLFFMVKEGTAALAPPGYLTDMPAYKNRLSDREIAASLAYIKSKWPQRIKARQADISRRALQGRRR